MTKTNIAIIGASGGIGSAFVRLLSQNKNNTVYAFARSTPPSIKNSLTDNSILNDSETTIRSHIDYSDEESIRIAAELTVQSGPLDLVIVATGFLHDHTITPEKSLRELSQISFQKNFLINTIGPALVAKHFLPKLHKDQRSVFTVLSARVGSISDNRLGGWYAYRASKAAVNMFIKTASIEAARKQKNAIIVGLHPGTVASPLSQPFQKNVAPEKLFTPEYAAKKLINVIQNLEIKDSGNIFAWDGKTITS
jgi:NAD(P)-dependent dehydrogenase (short-subunit alcohol dehydrogenase family)